MFFINENNRNKKEDKYQFAVDYSLVNDPCHAKNKINRNNNNFTECVNDQNMKECDISNRFTTIIIYQENNIYIIYIILQ